MGTYQTKHWTVHALVNRKLRPLGADSVIARSSQRDAAASAAIGHALSSAAEQRDRPEQRWREERP